MLFADFIGRLLTWKSYKHLCMRSSTTLCTEGVAKLPRENSQSVQNCPLEESHLQVRRGEVHVTLWITQLPKAAASNFLEAVWWRAAEFWEKLLLLNSMSLLINSILMPKIAQGLFVCHAMFWNWNLIPQNPDEYWSTCSLVYWGACAWSNWKFLLTASASPKGRGSGKKSWTRNLRGREVDGSFHYLFIIDNLPRCWYKKVIYEFSCSAEISWLW